MATFRLEIVTARAGLEHFIWTFLPGLVPTAHSENFVIYACALQEPLDAMRHGLLDGWVEEEIIIAYKLSLSESGQEILNSHVTPVEAAEISGYSEVYWRQKAWRGSVPGAYKAGKQWLIPRTIAEEQKKEEKGGKTNG